MLEQLKFIEMGIKIRMIEVEHYEKVVDTLEDLNFLINKYT